MKKYSTEAVLFLCVIIGFLSTPASAIASTSATYTVTSGFDASTGTPRMFTNTGTKSDIAKLDALDNKRIQSDAPSWPTSETFEEGKYIEFVFSGSVPVGAIIERVVITHEFRRSGSLGGAKLEVWDGTGFADFPLTMGAQNADHADTLDVTSALNTPEKVNSTKARFLAYRGDGKTKTSHDYIGLTAMYREPDEIPLPDQDTPDDYPTVEDHVLTTSVDTPLTITFSGIDRKGHGLLYSTVSNPSRGTLGPIIGDTILYTPDGTLGEDYFSYTAFDSIDTSAPATIHMTNTVGVLRSISIDAWSTTALTGDAVQVSVYGEDQFGNVPPDIIYSSVTGDAILDTDAGLIIKPTPGTATISASSGDISAVPIDIVWSDPVQEQIVVVVPPEEPVLLRMNSGHPAVSDTRNPALESGSFSEKTDTPTSLLLETVAIEIPSTPLHMPDRAQVRRVLVSPETTHEDIKEIIPPEMLAATAGSAYPIDRRLAIWAILLILFLVIYWRIYRHAKQGYRQ